MPRQFISSTVHFSEALDVTNKIRDTKARAGVQELKAVINFSALQRSPLERVECIKSSVYISVKYFSDFYISYWRGI
jgi:hypothetical protein